MIPNFFMQQGTQYVRNQVSRRLFCHVERFSKRLSSKLF